MQEKKIIQTQEFYNGSAKKFSNTRNYWWPDLDFVREYLRKGLKILDFGCGNGRLLEIIKDKDEIDYTGVDFSAGLIEEAKKRYPHHSDSFFQADLQGSLPDFSDQSFDRVFSIAVYHHFDPAYLKNHLQEVERVLKTGGFLVVSVWYLWKKDKLKYLLKNPISFNFSFLGSIPFNDNGKIYHRPCYWWTKGRLEKVFVQAGFVIEKSGYTYGKNDEKRNMFFVLKKI